MGCRPTQTWKARQILPVSEFLFYKDILARYNRFEVILSDYLFLTSVKINITALVIVTVVDIIA